MTSGSQDTSPSQLIDGRISERAFEALIRAAVTLNTSKVKKEPSIHRYTRIDDCAHLASFHDGPHRARAHDPATRS